MGGILAFLSDHQIISSLGIVMTLVVVWVWGYLRGHRHGEEAEMDCRYSKMVSLEKRNEQLREKVIDLMAENDQWRRMNSSMAAWLKLGMPNTASGSKEPPTPLNHKEGG